MWEHVVNRSSNPHKHKQRGFEDQRMAKPNAQLNDGITGETLGVDLMLDNQCIFQIVEGKSSGFIHLTPLDNKEKAGIVQGIKGIIQDYARNKVRVSGLDTRHSDASTVTRTESDNDGGYMASGSKVLAGANIHIQCTFVPSREHAREHATYVERTIRTIKERAHSVRIGLKFALEGKLACNGCSQTWSTG